MLSKIILLNNRSIIEISGSDRFNFLQGIITNDINKIKNGNIIYSAMLNPQGRFLYDFFIFENDQKIFLDCSSFRSDELLKKLFFYKLRSDVAINLNKEISIVLNFDYKNFKDPRFNSKYSRSYIKNDEIENYQLEDESNYHIERYNNKIAEGEYDLFYDKSFILEYGFNNMNAIDFGKGCYVGQEVVARTHYRGEIRKEVHQIFIENINQQLKEYLITKNYIFDSREFVINNIFCLKGYEIIYQEKKIGLILSSLIKNNCLHGLILLNCKDYNLKELENNLEILDNKINIT